MKLVCYIAGVLALIMGVFMISVGQTDIQFGAGMNLMATGVALFGIGVLLGRSK